MKRTRQQPSPRRQKDPPSPAVVERAEAPVAVDSRKRRKLLDRLVRQLRPACERFLQETLAHTANAQLLATRLPDLLFPHTLLQETWQFLYQLLAILKSEAVATQALSWLDASNTLPAILRSVADAHGGAQGSYIERIRHWWQSRVGRASILTQLNWEPNSFSRLVASLVSLGESNRCGKLQAVPYADLEVEDLGRIHELLLEIEPGIAAEPMTRLRRGRIEVVVPRVQSRHYRTEPVLAKTELEDEASETEEPLASGVRWIADLPPGQFFLRTGLTRKGAGAYYTPQAFVRFLVQATLGPTVAERSPDDDPCPAAIVGIKVLDPAMGTGHFLIEACRFLGQKLLVACRACVSRTHDDSASHSQHWQERILALGDEGEALWQLLQSNALPEISGKAQPLSQTERLCRQIVARHCLYGVDRNGLSVEMARLALALEVGTCELSPEQLEPHLIKGDSLAGPRIADLRRLPAPDALDLPQKLWNGLQQCIDQTAASGETTSIREATQRLELRVALKIVAAAWSGGVQLGDARCDEHAWLALIRKVVERGRLPEKLDSIELPKDSSTLPDSTLQWRDQPLHAMLARGLGLDEVPAEREALETLCNSDRVTPAISFELAFPEVWNSKSQGFDVVLGNPPWEAVRPQRTEFFGNYDVACWAGHTRRERSAAEKRLLNDPAIAGHYASYLDQIEGTKRVFDRLYEHQKVFIDGDLAGRYLDQYRVFLERKAQLASRNGGRVGVVVPASFRANAGAVGLRRLYLLENQLEFLYTFRNTRQSFEVASGMQFCLLSARFGVPATRPANVDRTFEMASHLEDEAWLFAPNRSPTALRYPVGLLEAVGGPHLTIVDFASEEELTVTRRLMTDTLPLGNHPLFADIPFQTNPAALNATSDAWRLQATSNVCGGDPRDPKLADAIFREGYAPLHEKGTFSRFQAREQTQPRYVVDLGKCDDRPDWLSQLKHFRLVGRSTIHASEPQKTVFALIPPGGLVSNSAVVEATPEKRLLESALAALAILNSHVFNFLARQQVILNLNLFILRNLRVPTEIPQQEFLARSALRLSANDVSYAEPYAAVFGTRRLQKRRGIVWPVMTGSERLKLEAAMNAIVAQAYGATRADYALVLEQGAAQLTHKERSATLLAFEKLLANGTEAFVQQHDPECRTDLPDHKRAA